MVESFVFLKLCRLREQFFEGQFGDEVLMGITQEIVSQNTPKLLNRKECAELLRVSLPTLDSYIHEFEDSIPFRVKNPNAKKRFHYVFDRDEVLEWQKSRLSDLRSNQRRSW